MQTKGSRLFAAQLPPIPIAKLLQFQFRQTETARRRVRARQTQKKSGGKARQNRGKPEKYDLNRSARRDVNQIKKNASKLCE